MTRWIALPLFLVATSAFADTPFDHRSPPPIKSQPKSTGYTGLGAERVSPEEIAQCAAPALADTVSRRIQP